MGILEGWEGVFCGGIKAGNYVGDIFGSLGGKPDFGPVSAFSNNPVVPLRRRGIKGVRARRG